MYRRACSHRGPLRTDVAGAFADLLPVSGAALSQDDGEARYELRLDRHLGCKCINQTRLSLRPSLSRCCAPAAVRTVISAAEREPSPDSHRDTPRY
jgi:hypothetical protein